MSAWMSSLLGDYAYRFYTIFADQIQIILATCFFCWRLRRRRLFPLRVLISFLSVTGVLILGVRLRTASDGLAVRMLFTFLQYAVIFPVLLFCYDEDWTLILKSCCTIIAAKEIAGSVYPVLQFMLGYDPHQTLQLLPLDPVRFENLNWLIYYVVHILIYYIVWRIVRRGQSREEIDAASRKRAVFLSLVTLVMMTVMGSITSHFRDESLVLYICTRIFVLTLAVFILTQYAGLEFRSRTRADMAMMEQILSEERKQFAQMKENIDIINMRCHDLKHQLEDFSGRLTDREIAELQEAMEIYDSNIRTGNEALDTVLYIHQLTCRKEGIIFTCLADGEALSFMRTRHVYALFNNAIGNALEAVRKVNDPGKRVIGLTVERGKGTVEIEIINYYEGNLQLQGAQAPGTTKADRRHHGFGTMSMRYIAEQYRGSLSLEAGHGIYTLHVSIPVPGDKAGEKG